MDVTKGPIEQAQCWYDETIRRLYEERREATRSYDRTIISLASGGLGFSILLATILSPHQLALWVCLLLTWITFGLSTVCTLSSFRTSAEGMKEVASHFADAYSKRLTVDEAYNLRPIRWDLRTQRLNDWSYGLFLAGCMSLLLYAAIGFLQEDRTMGKQQQDHSTEKGVTPEQAVTPPLSAPDTTTPRDPDKHGVPPSDVVPPPVSVPIPPSGDNDKPTGGDKPSRNSD